MSNFPRLDETGLNTLLNKIATDVTGQLDDLETTEKSSLVGAINETRYKEWSGTQAQYAAAVAQGLIPDGTIVTITDSPTPTGDLNEHIATFIHSQSGVHGIRYYQNKLEYYDEELEEWVEIETGGGTTIVQIPSVVIGTYTYNGTEQAPVITGLDAEHTVITGVTASTTPGDFTFTIALKDPTKMVWSDMSITALTYNWSMAKAACPTTVSANSVTLDADHLTASVTLANVTGAVTVTSSDSTIATAALSGNTIAISNVNRANGTATITIAVAESQNYLAGSLSITVSAEFSQTVTVTLYSAANDTVSFTDYDGSKTVVTDSSGIAQNVSISIDPNKTSQSITFSSSVAKDLHNLSNDYQKTIAVTPDTAEIYVMPDGNIIYWYGYMPNILSFRYGIRWDSTRYKGDASETSIILNNNEICLKTQSNKKGLADFTYSTGIKYTHVNKICVYGKTDNITRNGVSFVDAFVDNLKEHLMGSSATISVANKYTYAEQNVGSNLEGYIVVPAVTTGNGTSSDGGVLREIYYKAIWLE